MNNYHKRNCISFILMVIFSTTIFAQTDLQTTSDDQVFNQSEAYEDHIIPTNLPARYNVIKFKAKGGNGGRAQVDDVTSGKKCNEDGGKGATITAEFLIGDEEGMIPKGSTIRLAIGKQGDDDSNGGGLGAGWCSSGGGGGTGILYKEPDSTDFKILVVAGGGAGSYQGMVAWTCVDNKKGGSGRNEVNGGDGEGPGGSNPGNGGDNGNGGDGGGDFDDLSGGGGGYNNDGGGASNLYGRKGNDTGGSGGYANNVWGSRNTDVPEGGWGFGGGGAGDEGGGGGGGYSGGGGGAKQGRGGGGGSYTNSIYLAKEFEHEDNQIGNGYTIINFVQKSAEAIVELNGSGAASVASSSLSGVVDCDIVNFDPINVDCSQVGTRGVNVTGTNSNGDQVSCRILMEIKDEIAPEVFCQNKTIYLDANGQASITNEDIDNGSNDACGEVSLSLSQYDFDCSHVGDNDVILTVTDINGNVATCTTTVTVIDQLLPSIASVSNITGNTSDDDLGDCDVVISWMNPVYSDNCDLSQTGTSLMYTLTGATIKAATSVSSFDGSTNSSEAFNIGTTIVTYTGTDANGNSAPSMSFEVTVTDDEIPVIANMNDLTPNTSDDGLGDCTVDVVWNHPSFIDNCNLSGGTTYLQYVLSGATTKSAVVATDFSGMTATMETFELGVTTVTYTGTDANGNDAIEKSFTVTVSDDEAPILIANPTVSLWNPDHSYQNFTLNDMIASFSDNCDQTLALNDVFIVQGTSDEDENGNQDGNTWDDILISSDCQSVQLRKERKGNGNGRVYTITLSMTDVSGNTGYVDFEVNVPNSNNGQAAVNSGVAYTEIPTCGGTGAKKSEILASPNMKVYPNPFKTNTMIQFEVPETQNIQIQVFNMNGQIVRNLFSGQMNQGQHSIKWNGLNDQNQAMAEGMYFVRMVVGKNIITENIV